MSRGSTSALALLASAFFISALAVSAGADDRPRPDRIVCDAAGCVSEAKLAEALCAPLDGKVVGYACRVGDRPATFGGLARTARDPPLQAFGPASAVNVASLSKTIAVIAVLRLLAENGLDERARIGRYLYADWPRGPNVERLTFRDLMTHRSGVAQANPQACASGDSYAALKAVVARGAPDGAVGAPAYGNCNFALLRELAPALLHRRLTLIDDGPRRAARSAALFLEILNDRVFSPAGLGRRSCRPRQGALAYPTPPDQAHGEAFGDWTLLCGAGGLQLSVDDLHAVLRALVSGETLLKADARKRMFAECLGSDCAIGADCPSQTLCKHGSLIGPSGAALWAYAGIVKCDLPVVVLVNSELPPQYQNGGNVFALVRDALAKAATRGKPAPCP